MDYQVSARKWRPQTFEDVVGQGHVAQTLINAIRQGRIAQAYLFSGMRGVGKTTMARVLAKALNCRAGGEAPSPTPCQTCESCLAISGGRFPDVVEIDGASNRGIDEVRELREVVKYSPMSGRYKIYIIDEVHMLTKEAFNALLKTLEEPPPHVVFIFATTEDHRIPSTILSRCQHFHFRRISRQDISGQLERILREEELRVSPEGLKRIAKAADGSLRDALSLMDQAAAFAGKEVTDRDLQVLLGSTGRAGLLSLIGSVLQRRTEEALRWVKEAGEQGQDPRQVALELVEILRHMVVARSVSRPKDFIDLPAEEADEIVKLSSMAGVEELQRVFGIFSQALDSFRGSVYPGFVLDMAVIRATQIPPMESFEDLLQRLNEWEDRGKAEGGPPVKPSSAKVSPSQGTKSAPADPVPSPRPGTGPGVSAAPIEAAAADRSRPVEVESPESPIPPSAWEEKIPSGPGLGPDELKQNWGRVLRHLVQERPNLASYLERGRVGEWISGGEQEILEIGFDDGSSFLGDLVQKEENRKSIADAIREVFGKPAQLRVVRMERSPVQEADHRQQKAKHEEQRKVRLRKETLSNPLLKDALDILGGEVIDIKEA